MKINNIIFKTPCSCVIAGPSQSGKSTVLKKILQDNKLLFSPAPTKIYYCYSVWSSGYEPLKLVDPTIEFIEGIMDRDAINP